LLVLVYIPLFFFFISVVMLSVGTSLCSGIYSLVCWVTVVVKTVILFI